MKDIINFLDKYLKLDNFKNDYLKNGLQVESTNKLTKRVCLAVDISLDTIDFAIEKNCELIITHHGLLWNNFDYITGRNYKIIRELIENNIALYSVHAPLDVHPIVGNSAQIIKKLNIKNKTPFGIYKNICWGYAGKFSKQMLKDEFIKKIRSISNSPIFHIVRPIKKIAVVSGAGAFAIQEVYEKSYDTLLTGEPSHSYLVYARDMNLNIVFAGHYNTEVFGVKALGRLLEKKFKIKTIFYKNNINI